jgi:hypothetical protein
VVSEDSNDQNVTDDELPDELDEEQDLPSPDDDLTADDVSSLVAYTLDWSVQSLLERIGTTFDINPAFQRRDAWNLERKSLYIESLMLGLPVPQVVLAEDQERRGAFLVLDGKQRLVTMKQFAAPTDGFRFFRLRKMQFLPHLDGKTFAEIDASLTDREYAQSLLAQPVRTIVLRGWSKPAVLYQVFVRLNQNSLPLSPQELRQALFPGPFTSWINDRSAHSTPIHRARRISREDFRMRDAEMLLRAVAFMDRFGDYNGNLRSFLDEQCRQGLRDWSSREPEYILLADRCERAIDTVLEIFGDDAFLRFEDGRSIRRFNIAVFDLIVTVLSSPELIGLDLIGRGPLIREAFERLCTEDPRFSDSLKTSTKTVAATGYRTLSFARAMENIFGTTLALTRIADQMLRDTE